MWQAALENRLVSACPVSHTASGWLSLLQAPWSCCHPCLSDFGLSRSDRQIVNDSNALHRQMFNLPLSLSRKGEETDLFTSLGWQRQKKTVKRNSIFSGIIQILRLNACNPPFQDFSPLMSDILICIQLQIKCAPFNLLREF